MIAGPLSPAAGPAPDGRLHLFEARAMGSPLRLTIVSNSHPAASGLAAAWDGVRDEFEAAEQAMSRFRDTSEITILNRSAGRDAPMAVSRRLSRALAASDRARRVTNGRFDPRVLSDLERLGDHGSPVGTVPLELGRRWRTGRIVQLEAGGLVRVPVPIDLGGIGKGLTLRWAAASLACRGHGAFLLEAGGDLITRGEPPEGGSWRVGIEDAAGGAEPLAVIGVNNLSVATSSVRRRRWRNGERTLHHLIDARTGEPGGAGLLAVTVAGSDAAWSEVWSKSLFLEGRSGIATLARRRGLAAWWVVEDGSLEMTPAARQRTLWARDEGA